MNALKLQDLITRTQWFPDFKSIILYLEYNEFVNNMFSDMDVKCQFDQNYNKRLSFKEVDCLVFDINVDINLFKNKVKSLKPKVLIISHQNIYYSNSGRLFPFLKDLNYGNHINYNEFSNLSPIENEDFQFYEKGNKLLLLENYAINNSNIGNEKHLKNEIDKILSSKAYKLSKLIQKVYLQTPFLSQFAKMIFKVLRRLKN